MAAYVHTSITAKPKLNSTNQIIIDGWMGGRLSAAIAAFISSARSTPFSTNSPALMMIPASKPPISTRPKLIRSIRELLLAHEPCAAYRVFRCGVRELYAFTQRPSSHYKICVLHGSEVHHDCVRPALVNGPRRVFAGISAA